MLVRAALVGVLVLLAACSSTVRSGAAIQPDPVYRETEVRHARPRLNGELFDPSESDPALASAFASADQKAERLVGNTKRDSQFITKFWSEKKRILKAEFGVTWRTPAEMNPQIRYANYGQPMLTDDERSALESLVSSRKQASESIHGMWRGFDGTAWVSTEDRQTDTGRIYRFTGHDTEWTFVHVGVLEY
jgi:hypothetical protein